MTLSLNNKRVLLGVTGGIAAYKSAELVRRLQDVGASVRVVMTQAAQKFITPLTMQALSGHPVHTDLLDLEAEAAMGHIELARWADVVLVAPASANFIAKLISGQGADLLQTLCLATKAPIALAPAMNQAMWSNQATQNNIRALAERGVHVMGPASGSQACGDVGLGRMLEVRDIIAQTAALFATGALAGKTVVITAGPTREALDPVRYISNHSSGKMGYALAQAAVDAGATTILVSGPVNLAVPDRVESIAVQSAQDMLNVVQSRIVGADIFISTAAVADYRPAQYQPHKIKKQNNAEGLILELVKNPDILASVAARDDRPFTVGFAAETENLVAHAKTKLLQKKLDMMVANNVAESGIGFNSEDNEATILIRNHDNINEIVLERRNKSQMARDIIQFIATALNDAHTGV